MTDSTARELKGHNILALERFQDKTRYMIEFLVKKPVCYGVPGDEVRRFLSEPEYQQVLACQQHQQIKIKRYARIIEGNIVIFNFKKHRRA